MSPLFRNHAPPAPPEYGVLPTEAPHDRLLAADDAAWQWASVVSWGPAAYLTQFAALWSARGLYLRFGACDDEPWHTMTERDEPLWEEEVVEIFLDPARTGRDYAEIEISPANVVCDLRIRQPWPRLKNEREWNWAGLETRVRRGSLGPCGGGWTATAALPWEGAAALSKAAGQAAPPAPGDRWRFNVFRVKRPGGPAAPDKGVVLAAWSVPPEGPSFHVPEVFRDLVFLKRARP